MYRSFSGPLFERNENSCPFLGEHLEPLYQPIRFKLASALTNWHPSDPSAKMILQPWTKVLFATSLLFKSHPASGAFLSLSRFWLPRSQSLTITFFLAGGAGGRGGGGIRGFFSKDVFERLTSTGSESFSLSLWRVATIFVFPSVFSLAETICPKICSKARPRIATRPLPVDVCRLKTWLLRSPNY